MKNNGLISILTRDIHYVDYDYSDSDGKFLVIDIFVRRLDQ